MAEQLGLDSVEMRIMNAAKRRRFAGGWQSLAQTGHTGDAGGCEGPSRLAEPRSEPRGRSRGRHCSRRLDGRDFRRGRHLRRQPRRHDPDQLRRNGHQRRRDELQPDCRRGLWRFAGQGHRARCRYGTATYSAGSGGSKTLYSNGLAVREAAADARRQVLAIAADEFEADPEDLKSSMVKFG